MTKRLFEYIIWLLYLPLLCFVSPAQAQRVISAESAPPGDSTAGELPVKYWGNLYSLKFHRPSCKFAKAMSVRNVIFFNFRKQAIDAGQSPCRYCLPPVWRSVQIKLLPRGSIVDEAAANAPTSAGSDEVEPEKH